MRILELCDIVRIWSMVTMANFQVQLASFSLNEELRKQFIDFETCWKIKDSPENPYKIITVINNDINGSKLEKEGKMPNWQ